MVVKFLHPTSEFCQTCTQAFEPHLAPLEGFPIFKSVGVSIPRSDISQSHSGRLDFSPESSGQSWQDGKELVVHKRYCRCRRWHKVCL
jgi:hypothetical protein